MSGAKPLAGIADAISDGTWYETEADHRSAAAHASDVMAARADLLAIADEMEEVAQGALIDPFHQDHVAAGWVWIWLGRIRGLCGEPGPKPGRTVILRP